MARSSTRSGSMTPLASAAAILRALSLQLLLLFLVAQGDVGAFQTAANSGRATGFVATTATEVLPSSTTRLYQARMPALLGRFRKKREVEQVRTIAVGDPLPDVDVEVIQYREDRGSDGGGDGVTAATATSTPMSIRQVLGESGSAVLVGMPGAFTPTCSNEHLPGYIASIPKLKALGIDKIAVMTTNDRHVNEEWGSRYGLVGAGGDTAQPVLTILSDGDGDLAKAMGLADDMGFGVGVRSKRFAMVVTDGVVSTLLTDEGMDDCSCTSAQNLLRVITPESTLESSEEGGGFGLALFGGGAAAVLGLVLALANGGGGGSTVPTTAPQAAPTPKVQVQPSKQPAKESSKGSFNLLNDYL